MGRMLLQDLGFAQRTLRKNLAFTATIVVTLALAIGASTVIFSVVDAVLLNPLDYKDPDRIFRIYTVNEQGLPQGSTGRVHIDPMIKDGQTIEAAFYGFSNETSVINPEGTAFAINEYRVSEGFFSVFTEPLHMGRVFTPEDGFNNTILSYQTWRDVFGSDPNIVGATIRVNNAGLRVLGVAAEGFEFPLGTAIWTKIYQAGGSENLFNLDGYARVKPGVSAAQFQAELDVFAGRLESDTAAVVGRGGAVGWEAGRKLEFVARPLLHDVVGDFRPTLFVVSGATAILLLIACLNVANLLFSRGIVRTSEIAVREALGAGRWRVFRQLMTESLVLCALGGILGSILAIVAVRILQAIGPEDLPRFDAVALSGDVFAFAAACVLLTVVIVGAAPALRSSRGDLSSLMNEGGRSAAGGRGRNRLFGTLVAAEIALAVVLVIGAGLLVRSYSAALSADPGFDPSRTLTFVLNVPGRLDMRAPRVDANRQVIGYEGTGYLPVARFYQELTRRIDALPGVAAAGAVSAAPLQAGAFPLYPDSFGIVGDPDSAVAGGGRVGYASQVAPEFFDALEIRPLAGRLLTADDRRDGAGVVVVNEAFARAYLGTNPIGRRITLPNPDVWRPLGLAFTLGERLVNEAEVVGVIPDIAQRSITSPVQPAVYVPHEQWTMRRMSVVVHADIDDPGNLIPAIRNEIAQMDPSIPAVFALYSDVMTASVARQKLGAVALVVFGLVSLTLAAVGVFGLVSYSASQRYNEIAVRSAMGADRGRVLNMFLGRALRLAGLGIAAGLVGAVALGQVIASQLYGVGALDPAVFLLVPLTMLAVTLLASYLPARRASRIDLSAALREN
jgi:putative ABC transport system permease protein